MSSPPAMDTLGPHRLGSEKPIDVMRPHRGLYIRDRYRLSMSLGRVCAVMSVVASSTVEVSGIEPVPDVEVEIGAVTGLSGPAEVVVGKRQDLVKGDLHGW